ncbi:unnamed protein product [Prorocentrum cordatum]|uniref:Acyltransferase 3 domain-containing protein n=1 Tax=Prorocentrum cordatum TaxID=2364126 RepID=A0ABN9RLG5_9DINO|nr:unnamed protein product [Polarella glacialis]
MLCNSGLLRVVASFLLDRGIVGYRLYRAVPEGWPGAAGAALTEAVLIAASMAMLFLRSSGRADFAAPWLWVLVIACFARESSWISQGLRWMAPLGKYAFSAYMGHWILLQALIDHKVNAMEGYAPIAIFGGDSWRSGRPWPTTPWRRSVQPVAAQGVGRAPRLGAPEAAAPAALCRGPALAGARTAGPTRPAVLAAPVRALFVHRPGADRERASARGLPGGGPAAPLAGRPRWGPAAGAGARRQPADAAAFVRRRLPSSADAVGRAAARRRLAAGRAAHPAHDEALCAPAAVRQGQRGGGGGGEELPPHLTVAVLYLAAATK